MRRLLRLASSLALVVALGGCYWLSPGNGTDRRSHNPSEDDFNPGTVGDFVAVWSAATDEVTTRGLGNPVTSTHGHVHVTSTHTAYAINANTGAVVWSHTSPNHELNTDLFVIEQGSSNDFVTTSYTATGSNFTVGVQWDAVTGQFIEGEITGRLDAIPPDIVGAVFTEFGASPTAPGGFVQHFYTFGTGFNRVFVTDQPDFDNHLTLGDGEVFHSGIGVGTSPSNGVRSWPINVTAPTWATPIDGTRSTSPVLSEDKTTVYVGTDAGTLYALDAASGAVLWSSAVGSAVTDSPALADGTLFVPTASGSLVALDAAGCGSSTCSPDWTTPAGASISVQPAVGGGVVFVGTADGTVAGFNAAGCGGGSSCPALWSDTTGSAITGAPAISMGKVFVGTQDGRLIAYGLPPA